MIALIKQRHLIRRLSHEKRLVEDHLAGRSAGIAAGRRRDPDNAFERLVGIGLELLRHPRLEIGIVQICYLQRPLDDVAEQIELPHDGWMNMIIGDRTWPGGWCAKFGGGGKPRHVG